MRNRRTDPMDREPAAAAAGSLASGLGICGAGGASCTEVGPAGPRGSGTALGGTETKRKRQRRSGGRSSIYSLLLLEYVSETIPDVQGDVILIAVTLVRVRCRGYYMPCTLRAP